MQLGDACTVFKSAAERLGGLAVMEAVGVLMSMVFPFVCRRPSTCPTSCANVHGDPSAETTHAG